MGTYRCNVLLMNREEHFPLKYKEKMSYLFFVGLDITNFWIIEERFLSSIDSKFSHNFFATYNLSYELLQTL